VSAATRCASLVSLTLRLSARRWRYAPARRISSLRSSSALFNTRGICSSELATSASDYPSEIGRAIVRKVSRASGESRSQFTCAGIVEREELGPFPLVETGLKLPARAPKLLPVEVDDAGREFPAEERLPGPPFRVVGAVGSNCDLEEERDGLVVEVGPQAGSEFPSCRSRVARASPSTSATSRSCHGRPRRLTLSLSPSRKTWYRARRSMRQPLTLGRVRTGVRTPRALAASLAHLTPATMGFSRNRAGEGGAYGIRTRATAVRGRRPGPLDECARLKRQGSESGKASGGPSAAAQTASGMLAVIPRAAGGL
jgi:hypothetical protein